MLHREGIYFTTYPQKHSRVNFWHSYFKLNYTSQSEKLILKYASLFKKKTQSVCHHSGIKKIYFPVLFTTLQKFVALTMTNDFIDIKVIGHGRGKQPKRRDTKKGWVQIHGLDICIPHTYCSKIRGKKVNFSILRPFFKFYFRMLQTVCVLHWRLA